MLRDVNPFVLCMMSAKAARKLHQPSGNQRFETTLKAAIKSNLEYLSSAEADTRNLRRLSDHPESIVSNGGVCIDMSLDSEDMSEAV